jgi:hypothetical protein
LEVLRHKRSFRPLEISQLGGVSLGTVLRDRRHGDWYVDENAGVVAALYGFPLTKASAGWGRLRAVEVARRVADGAARPLGDTDGPFVAVLLDLRARRLVVVADAHGSLPVFFASTEEGTAFAPEAKSLFQMLRLRPRLDSAGALQFLNLGHTFGGTTLFEGVTLLGPGQALEIDLDDGRAVTRTWDDLRFEPDRRLSLTRASSGFFDAVLASQQALEVLEVDGFDLALTGGFDSRLVLGTLPESQRGRTATFAWGVDGELPGSDPLIARQLAEAEGFPFRFLRYGSESVAPNLPRWLYVSELVTDNLGYFAAEDGFLEPSPDGAGVVLTGDHLVGLAGLPDSREAAVEAVTFEPFGGIHPCLEPLVTASRVPELAVEFRTAVDRIVNRCPSEEPRDVQDYLFHHLHAPGWLWSAGFYKEPMAFAFRPLLLAPVRQLVSRLPAAFRGDKRVLVEALRRNRRALMRFPLATAHSAIDWRFDSRNETSLRRCLEDLTSPESFGSHEELPWLDESRVAQLLRTYFSERPQPVSRGPSASRRLAELRRVLVRNRFAARLTRFAARRAGARLKGRRYELSAGATYRIVFRLALLNGLRRLLRSGAFDPKVPAERGADR